MAMGVMMVYSSSAILAQERFHDSLYFLKRDALFTFLGILLILIVKNIDYHVYYKWTYPTLAVVLGLLVLVFIPGIGHKAGGAQRWIRLGGIGLQPSEFTKLGVVFFLAYALTKKGDLIKSFSKGFLPILLVAGTFAGLVLLQRDLGTAFLIGVVSLGMLYIAGTRLSYLLFTILATCPVLYFLIFNVEYRRKRILAFLNPWEHQWDSGFQIIQSYVAFNSGGLTGSGLGQGKQKLFYLPAAHTDFIFSVIGEELGFIGVSFVLFLFLILLFRGTKIAFRAPDSYGTFLASGITIMIISQALLNFGVVMGLLPTKGLPLPFLSHGGTALLVLCIMVGILLNISSQARQQK